MNYKIKQIAEAKTALTKRFKKLKNKADILKAPELKRLYKSIPSLEPSQRKAFGSEVNQLKTELESLVQEAANKTVKSRKAIDITAPFDVNTAKNKKPTVLNSQLGSIHPLMRELDDIVDIFYRMGFEVVEPRQIDDDYHMFESLNFPPSHPARDDYDTFVTSEGFVAPAHTSTMQNRVLQNYKHLLDQDEHIRVVIPGRVFRNEDVDARHEHTFYQVEGVCVGQSINVGNLIATLESFLQEYFKKNVEVKTQPSYFPFTEPSLEFVLTCPFCDKKGCHICSQSGWIEWLGCGMIHPNVLKMAGINPDQYTGFAWGGGVDRLVMIKYGIEDVRHFHSGKLEFLRQFS